MQLRLTSLRSSVLLLGAVLVALTIGGGPATGDSSSYPSTLYLSGGPSSLVNGSFQLVGTAGPSTPGTPTVSLVSGGSLTGTYSYIAVAGSSGSYTASLISTSAVASSQNITVGNLPSGTAVDIYRQKTGCLPAGSSCPFYYVGNSGGATTFTDSLSDASAALNKVLPEASNRITYAGTSTCAATTCGYLNFSPGVEPAPGASTNLTPPTLTTSPSTTPNNYGWIVDGTGSVAIPAGTWTFQVRTKSSNPNGVAHLVVGVWKVTTSGGAIAANPTTILDPTSASAEDTATNLVTTAGTVQTVTFQVSLPAVSLTAGQHLYVQFWRRQTTAYTTGSTTSHLATMMAYDSLAQIDLPAAASNITATLVTPATAADTNSDALTATFGADATDTGTVTFNVCSDSACSDVVASGTSSTVANGANASWTPTGLADGTYWWQAQATDAAGGQSSWTPTQSFTYDTTPPNTTIGTGPANPNNSTSATFTFSSSETGSTFQCELDSGGFSACTSPMSYNALANGSHTFQVEATDAAGNTDPTPASSTWTVDTVAPVTSITASPANLTNATGASFSFGANKAGSTFQCRLDGGSFSACTSPASYSGLADGSHTFQVKATDTAGNTGSASSSWTVDTTPPDTTISSAPASPVNTAAATLSFGSSKSGSTFQCQLDGGGYSACTSPQSYTGLADGSHTFRVEATDGAGNTDPTPAAVTWTVDTTPPTTTITSGPPSLTNATSATFGFGSTESSTFQCQLDGGGFSACTSPAAFSGLAPGTHTFQVEATDAAGNTDPSPPSVTWTVDTTPPGAPGSLTGTTGAGGLKLSWTAPAGGPIAQYVLYVNGIATTRVDGGTTSTTVGDFSTGDTRTFAVAAIDGAGNEGPFSVALTAVPDLVGLPLSQADATLQARGFVIGKQTLGASDSGSLVVSQQPTGGTLAPLQSTVLVTFADPSVKSGGAGGSSSGTTSGAKAPLAVRIAGAQSVTCAQGNQLALHIQLDRKANVAVRFLTAAGVRVGSMKLAPVHAGSRTLNLRLPFVLSKGKSYRVIVTASIGGQVVQDEIKLTIVRKGARTTASARACG